ncbi:MAG: MbnP family protein [Owenweeksia sp.]|nr:MbnP family protein [Owenweeksia sp.]
MMRITGIVILVLSVGLASCETDPVPEPATGDVKFVVKLMNDTQEVKLNDKISLKKEYDLNLSLFKMYLTRIEATDKDGNIRTAKDVALVGLGNDNENSFTAQLPVGNYDQFKMGFGVDAAQNNADHKSFPNSHPLATYQSMYWDMLKYRFVKMEGKADSRTGGPTNILVAYHTGTDPLYQRKTFSESLNISVDAVTEVVLQIDLNEILDGPAGSIDFATQNQTHSDPSGLSIARVFMENLAASAEVEVK